MSDIRYPVLNSYRIPGHLVKSLSGTFLRNISYHLLEHAIPQLPPFTTRNTTVTTVYNTQYHSYLSLQHAIPQIPPFTTRNATVTSVYNTQYHRYHRLQHAIPQLPHAECRGLCLLPVGSTTLEAGVEGCRYIKCALLFML